MRCHGSICRWSPFLGICLSKSTGPIGCTTYGAIAFASAPGLPSISRCQWASGPSPSEERMPMPVIQASRARSAMARDLERKRELARPRLHVGAELGVGERHGAEPDLRLAHRLAVGAGEPRLGHRE